MTTPAAPPFPSLVIRDDELIPQGSFAEAQAEFLHPDPTTISELSALLRTHEVGVVAHFYMDPELQGVLSAVDWPHIQISDSLMMADAAITMAKAGVKMIVVLGVDFMSENVRAMLDATGFTDIPVYRVAAEEIGCSLAASAEAAAYGAYLTKASQTPNSLHVIYINTGLDVKARAHHLVPTVTCTSSNVVKTVLQAAAQVPDISIWFGPDTYMGQNLRNLFEGLAGMDDDAIRAVHPDHDRSTITSLLERFHFFEQGTCIVHHMFGADVVEIVKRDYADVLVTAHLEVPGEMFHLALGAQKRGDGVVGSTSNILAYITQRVNTLVAEGTGGRLRFILGTEAGMITSIVRRVQHTLRDNAAEGGPDIDVEIIFPVAGEAVAQTADSELVVVPGVLGGEGCTTAGGCATCPFMKMNSLDALTDLVGRFGESERGDLSLFFPRQYVDEIGGRTAADLGGEPILHMRHFQRNSRFSDELIADIVGRRAAS
jgi:quinolinate synthase